MPGSLNRREFLKSVGLAGAGVTLASSGVAEAAASNNKPNEVPYRYWWVKYQDKPTIEIDWKQVQRFKEWKTTRGSLSEYRSDMYGEGFHKKLNDLSSRNKKNWEANAVSGYTTKDVAFKAAAGYGRPTMTFMGPQKTSTPEERGVPRYEGTPEENSQIIRAAARHLGASSVGFVELDTNTTMKLIYDEQPNGDKRKIRFENIDVGYETDDKLAIPDKARYAIVFSVQMSGETMQRGPTLTGSNTTGLSYTRLWLTLAQMHEFIHGLGWQSYGTPRSNGLGIYPAMATMAGLGEMSRLNRVITPQYGPMVRFTFLLTDLPLAPTKPINFGVMEFCKHCKRCADLCPSKSLSFDTEPSWEVQGQWNNPGHKAYFENSVTCRNYWSQVGTNCGICFAVCPYTMDDEATIQKIWKATAATTPAFDSTVTRIQNAAFPAELGKPIKSPESWWENENMPEYGINTMRGGRKL